MLKKAEKNHSAYCRKEFVHATRHQKKGNERAYLSSNKMGF
jgi:hypothetical protein